MRQQTVLGWRRRLCSRHANLKGTTMFKGLIPSLVIIAALITAVPAAVVAAF
jgi:hypothetical protein